MVLEKNAYGFSNVYQMKGARLIYKGDTNRVIFPDDFEGKDTSYFSVYFTGKEKSPKSKAVFCIIGHNGFNDRKIWLDQNGDFDFSNDGSRVDALNDSSFVVTVLNSQNSKAKFPVSFINNQSTTYTWPGKVGMKKDGSIVREKKYWLENQRMNTRVAYFQLEGIKYQIGIYDYDCNGKYNDVGKDQLLISVDSTLSLSRKAIKGAMKIADTTLIELNGKEYHMMGLNEAGDSLNLERSNFGYEKQLRIGNKIKDLDVLNVDSTIASLSSIYSSKQYTLLYCWGTWCGGCHYHFPEVNKIAIDFSNKINFVAMNYGDSKETIEKYHKTKELNWQQTYLTAELKSYFNVEGFPTCILLSQKGEILFYNSHSSKIRKFLEKIN